MPKEEELCGLGITIDDYQGDITVEVWPENWKFVQVFIALKTQWRVGPCGATGLDYNVMPNVFRLRGIPRKEWPIYFDAIRIMENASLEEM